MRVYNQGLNLEIENNIRKNIEHYFTGKMFIPAYSKPARKYGNSRVNIYTVTAKICLF